jgi:hypothetical protein
MTKSAKPVAKRAADTPEVQLQSFIDKFAPAQQTRIVSLRKALRKRLPGANELVYDNYNFFVIGYSPTERPSDAVVSIAADAKKVSLCFIQGAALADPDNLLMGAGKQTRFLRLDGPATLDEPGVKALLAAAVAHSPERFSTNVRGKLVIRSVSAKQRPRRVTGD